MPRIVSRTTFDTSTYVFVVISPATTTRPVVTSVSQATRPSGSSRRTASRTASETWSAILSGCPSVTDSDVKRNSRAGIRGGYLFPRRPPAHQPVDDLRQPHIPLQHGADALRDRQLDSETMRQVAQHRSGGQALHGLPDRGRRLLRRRTAGDQRARRAVPAVARLARDDQVAHPGEAGERLLPPAARFAEPGDRKSTRLNSSHEWISYA